MHTLPRPVIDCSISVALHLIALVANVMSLNVPTNIVIADDERNRDMNEHRAIITILYGIEQYLTVMTSINDPK
jgi:hypothetical protein